MTTHALAIGSLQRSKPSPDESRSMADSGLVSLAMLLRLRGATITTEDLRRHLGDGAVGIVEMLRGARAYGFKGRSISADWKQLVDLPLPCIAGLRDGSFLLLGKVNNTKAVVVAANVEQPVLMTQAEFEAQWSGRLILAKRSKAAKLLGLFENNMAAPVRRAMEKTPRWQTDARAAVTSLAVHSQTVQRAILTRTADERRVRSQQLAFLPAALEIVETPPSPLGRTIGWSIISIFAIALAWACIGTVDIVAIAPGKIIPSDRTKTIQPFETGVVHAIQVQDGQSVKAGDVLIELDTTAVDAELRSQNNDLMAARLDIARLQAAISNRDDSLPAFAPPVDAPTDLVQMYRGLLISQSSEQKAKLATIDSQLAQSVAVYDTITASIEKLKSTIVPLQQRVDIREQLFQKGLGSKIIYLSELQELVGQRQDILVLERRGIEANAAVAALKETRAKTVAEYERTLFDELSKAQQKMTGLKRDVVKAELRRNLQMLKAPVDGVVQQLAIHTIGGVVTPAQTLMYIVPAESQLEVEAMISNKDIGFVNAGQDAAIKIDTFNFTRYGLLQGRIIGVSQDAIARNKIPDSSGDQASGADTGSSEPRGQELLYAARISLSQTQLEIEDKRLNLSPGMAITAEIKTGKRRIISYLLSPLARYHHNSLRER